MNTLGSNKDIVEVKGLIFSDTRFYDCYIELTIYERIDFLSQQKYLDISYSDIYDFLITNFHQEEIRDLTTIILKNNTILRNKFNSWVIQRNI